MPRHRNVRIEADGGSRGNPGPAGYGAVLKDADTGEVLAEASESIGVATNNVAEYRGLVAGLQLYDEHAAGAALEVRMDSQLVINQMAGRWKVKHPDMRPLAIQARRLAPSGTEWTWVRREHNKHADRLANEAMDRAAGREASGSGDPPATEPPDSPGAQLDKNPMLGWSQNGVETQLVFLRHGVTAHTIDKRFSGPGGENPGLLEEGRAQAKRAADALVADGADVLLSSPLQRTLETAEFVSEALALPVEVEDGFRECAFGDWDALTLPQVAERWPEKFDAWLHSMDVAPPGGESLTDVRRRVEAALAETVQRYPGQKVIIVSHVNPIKLTVRYCLDAPMEIVHRMHMAAGSITTCSFYESGATALRRFSALP